MSSTKRKRSDTGDSKNGGDMSSKKAVKHAYKHVYTADPSSYSLAVTTIQQQSEKESNFIGDAFFFQTHLPQVQRSLAGDYVIVYARPKTSRSYPRRSAIETFDPKFANRIKIETEGPKDGGMDAARIKKNLDDGFWGVGSLRFNGARVNLSFEPPSPGSKEESHVSTDASEKDTPDLTTLLGKVLAWGPRPHESTALFGIKTTVLENNVQYGFNFIALNLAVYNQKTGLEDIHHIVGVKVPAKGDISSAFILKQPLVFPHLSWYRWHTHLNESRRNPDLRALLPAVEREVSDWYEEEQTPRKGKEDESMDDWKGS